MSRGPTVCHLAALPRQHLYFSLRIDVMLDLIELMFNSLNEFHLKIKPKMFFDTSVLCSGHMLSGRGILTNPEKWKRLGTGWPPQMQREVHSFLGLASYCCSFIPKFVQMAHHIHELVGMTSKKTKKGKGQKKERAAAELNQTEERIFRWMPKHQKVFDGLKEVLVTAPVLGYPYFKRQFMLETHDSLQVLGAMLSQLDETGRLHVIAYESWSLHPAERSSFSKNRAAGTEIGSHWKNVCLFARLKSEVYTDNNPLAFMSERGNSVCQIRWLSKLALFDFTIHYWTGRSNRAANALSRHHIVKTHQLKVTWTAMRLKSSHEHLSMRCFHIRKLWKFLMTWKRGTINLLCSTVTYWGGGSRRN